MSLAGSWSEVQMLEPSPLNRMTHGCPSGKGTSNSLIRGAAEMSFSHALSLPLSPPKLESSLASDVETNAGIKTSMEFPLMAMIAESGSYRSYSISRRSKNSLERARRRHKLTLVHPCRLVSGN